MRLFITLCFLSLPLKVFASGILFKDARVLLPVQGSTVTAGYAVLSSKSDKPLVLNVQSATHFKAIELHQSLEKEGRMSMEKVDTITVDSKKDFEFKPGGHHIMLFEPAKNLKEGDFITVTFKIDGKSVTQKFKLVSRESEKEDHSHHH
jgi:copper(I)-binding protein